MKNVDLGEGIIAQEAPVEQCVDDDSTVLAFLKLFKNGQVGLMWGSHLFGNPEMPMPDELREGLVRLLRFHADVVESRRIDGRMEEIRNKMKGQT